MAKGSGTTRSGGSRNPKGTSGHNPPTYEGTRFLGNFGETFDKSYQIREKEGKYYVYYVSGDLGGGAYSREFSKPYSTFAEAKLTGHKMYGMDLKDAIVTSYSNAKGTTETVDAPSGSTTFYTNPLREYVLGKDKVTTYIVNSSGRTGYGFSEFIAKQGNNTIAHSQNERKLISMIEDYLVKKNK